MFPMVILLNYALSLSSQLYTNWLIIFPVESIFGQTLEDNLEGLENQKHQIKTDTVPARPTKLMEQTQTLF